MIKDIRKEIINTDIMFLFVIVGEISDKKKNELSKIQDKFGIRILSISEEYLRNTFKLSDSICGIFILLDKNNRVKFYNTGITVNQMIKIIKYEIK